MNDYRSMANVIRIMAFSCKSKDVMSCEFGNEFGERVERYLVELLHENMTAEEIVENRGYLCGQCAQGFGWEWPDGHCATMHEGVCCGCGKTEALSCWNDWLINGEQKEWD